jgi:hypothetical protein
LKGGPKAVDTATVDIGLVLIASPSNLVEVAKDQPTNTGRRLVSNKLREKIIFPVASGRAIDGCDFEITFIIAIERVRERRQTKLRSLKVGHMNH